VKFLVVRLDLDYLFKLASRDRDHLASVHFSNEGTSSHYCKCPMYKVPIVGNMYFFDAKSKNGCWLN
jgi:hypothetical protein